MENDDLSFEFARDSRAYILSIKWSLGYIDLPSTKIHIISEQDIQDYINKKY